MGGWRYAGCHVERDVCTDDYGQQRTETDNTDDRPAGVQNKPYLHKPRKRHYLQTTSRLSGNSRTTGAKPAAKGRYRDAIREFCQGGGEGVDSRPQPSRRPPTRLAGASENAPSIINPERQRPAAPCLRGIRERHRHRWRYGSSCQRDRIS